jgi:hypothetical protein
MSFFTKALPCALILFSLCACDKQQDSSAGLSSATAQSADAELNAAALKSAQHMTAFDLSKADFSPIGQADCDAFLVFAKQCFSTVSMPGAEILIPPYFEHMEMLRRMAKETPPPAILKTLCKQQLDSKAQLKESMRCEG